MLTLERVIPGTRALLPGRPGHCDQRFGPDSQRSPGSLSHRHPPKGCSVEVRRGDVHGAPRASLLHRHRAVKKGGHGCVGMGGGQWTA